MNVNQKGHITYDLTLSVFDDIGFTDRVWGTNATRVQQQQEALSRLRVSLQSQLVREQSYSHITKSRLKELLLEKTGSARLHVLKRLDLQYANGNTEIVTHFNY